MLFLILIFYNFFWQKKKIKNSSLWRDVFPVTRWVAFVKCENTLVSKKGKSETTLFSPSSFNSDETVINSIERRWLEEESGVFSFGVPLQTPLVSLYQIYTLDFWNTWKPDAPHTRSLAHTNHLRFDFSWTTRSNFFFPLSSPLCSTLVSAGAAFDTLIAIASVGRSSLILGHFHLHDFIPLCRWYRQLSWPYTLSSILSDTINLDDYVSNFVAMVTPN